MDTWQRGCCPRGKGIMTSQELGPGCRYNRRPTEINKDLGSVCWEIPGSMGGRDTESSGWELFANWLRSVSIFYWRHISPKW